MFATRVKIFLSALGFFTFVLMLRAMQVQVFERDDWQIAAADVMTKPEMLSTSRGALLDCKGRIIAEDNSCFDACVDFDALPDLPESAWLHQIAVARVNARSDAKTLSKSQRISLIEAEQQQVLTDLDTTWKTLAIAGNVSLEQIDDLRHSIVQKVESRGEAVTNLRFAAAKKEQQDKPPAKWYERIFNEGEGEELNRDDYRVDLAESHQPHPILRAIDNDTRNRLSMLGQRFPWVKVLPSVQRIYPYGAVAPQLIGRESAVTREIVAADPNKDDALRKYWSTDLMGVSGLEALCEPALRGSRGRVERRYSETTEEVSNTPPQAGKDVKCTIDIELQQEIQDSFNRIKLKHSATVDTPAWEDTVAMPGAAVVIDVPTGEVRALVSMPTYDANRFDQDYDRLSADVINRPLLNRATQLAYEPGSTVKPMVGIGAIDAGVNSLDEKIECTGYLVLDGRKFKTAYRCWTMKMWHKGHHEIPDADPHVDGFLTFSDAIQRSCNVFFETTADRLGLQGVAGALSRFGMGRPTGVGVAEVSGELPELSELNQAKVLDVTLRAGIGQGHVRETPIQVANEAATLARDGIWIRPHLVRSGVPTAPVKNAVGPDRVDLKLNPEAVREAQTGMFEVVNTVGGTGNTINTNRAFKVCGKTGSAQAAFLVVPMNRPLDPGEEQVPNRNLIRMYPGTHEHPNPRAPWYRYTGNKEDERSHAWYMGYAPADNPKVAVAVLVEFGGGGGAIAGQVFDGVLDALVAHGYLPGRSAQVTND